MKLITIVLMTLLSTSTLAKREINWEEINLPSIPSTKMWCIWTEYLALTETIYMCTYECENGMQLNIPGDGYCADAVTEIRW